jgi:hypothetical protein
LYFVEGVPTETIEDFQMTQDMIKRLDTPPYQLVMYLPYPGTVLYDYCIEKGYINQPVNLFEWAEMTQKAAKSMNLSEVRQDILDVAMNKFAHGYAFRPLRFTFRHNPTYFFSLISNPVKFYRAVKNFTRYYITRPSWHDSIPDEPSFE